MYKTSQDVLKDRIAWLHSRDKQIRARKQSRVSLPGLIEKLSEMVEEKEKEAKELESKAMPAEELKALQEAVKKDNETAKELADTNALMIRRANGAKKAKVDVTGYKDYPELAKKRDELMTALTDAGTRSKQLSDAEAYNETVNNAKKDALAVKKEMLDSEAELRDIELKFADEDAELKEIPLRLKEAKQCLGLMRAQEYTWEKAVAYWRAHCRKQLLTKGTCDMTDCPFYDRKMADCDIKLRLASAPLHWSEPEIEALIKRAAEEEDREKVSQVKTSSKEITA